MGFLSGSISFERFQVSPAKAIRLGQEHIEILQRYASGQSESISTSEDNVQVGFLAGSHLLDQQFDLDKNIIHGALHCGVRIDTNQVPSAMRKAWLQMELAALAAENDSGKPTKAQRQEAKEAVQQRCEDEVRSGKYHKMQQFPVLWDAPRDLLYFGGSSGTAAELCAGLFTRAFDIELDRITASTVALNWADASGQRAALEDITPCAFHGDHAGPDVAWLSHNPGSFDFLGNEFLLWLWWYMDTESDTLNLPDDSEVTVMLTRTLSLECPRGESGKETITAESPVRLPEAMQAIRSGKLPRKTGMTLVRNDRQYDFVLQAELFSIGAAKVQIDEEDDERNTWENRIDAVRCLSQTIDLLFHAFLMRRVSAKWNGELDQIRRWVQAVKSAASRKPAA